MCGICGIITKTEITPADTQQVVAMNEALIHRGPNSAGYFSTKHITLAMRRLSIIDLAGGQQPLFSEDKTIALIVNGEIYNYIELRAELKAKGHRFATGSDCETIIHAYEEYGDAFLQHLRGMFAFCLYDAKDGQVLLARDRLGEKPLYYYYNIGTEFVFSSEMKSLLLYLRPKGLEIDPDAVNMYFHFQYVPEPLTCIKGVKKLPAAHFIKLKTQNFSFTLQKYWDMEDASPLSGNPAKMIRESFEELGQYIIRADVPVGVALSGGLDSSAIACVAARHSASGLTAFTVGYPGKHSFDERRQAESLSRILGMKFHSVELRTEDLVNCFPELVYATDDPIADVAAFGYYSVSRLAREHGVPVLLFGFGGDELFWGYRWARELLQWNFLKKEIMSGGKLKGLPLLEMARIFSRSGKRQLFSHPVGSVQKIFREMRSLNCKFAENPLRFILWDENPDFKAAFGFKKKLVTSEFEGSVSEEALYAPFSTQDWSSVPLKTCRFLFDPWNVSNAVPQGDRLGMAFSVETRLPFLDHKFIELVIGLRKTYVDDYKLGSKGWLIEAMRGIVPEEVLTRPKIGFTPPREEWLKAVVERYGKYCLDGCLVSKGILRKDSLADFFTNPSTSNLKLFLAYKLTLMELWLTSFIEGKHFDAERQSSSRNLRTTIPMNPTTLRTAVR